jgi:drug/metabolite transporter (DMT)-like permease
MTQTSSHTRADLRGILFMVLSMGSFIVNDSFLKVVIGNLPPFEALFFRGIASILWGVPLLALTGGIKALPLVADRRVLFRNAFEMIAVIGYVLGLASAPIADLTALSQLSPMFVMIGAFWLFGERIQSFQFWLIVVAFIGAVMVAQPGMSGFTPFALFGLWNAVCIAGRDLSGRKVGLHVPGLVVAIGAAMIVVVGALIIGLIFERWVMPDGGQLLMLVCSGLFLTFGHMFVFLAYRVGSTGAVLPFAYTSTVWALISGAIVFGVLPNALALLGIGLIVLSGVLVVLVRRGTPAVATVDPTP